MTEAQWMVCKAPLPMLEFLRGKVSDRKLRLFACACCRRARRLFDDIPNPPPLDAAERHADGLAANAELWALLEAGLQVHGGSGSRTLVAVLPKWWPLAIALHDPTTDNLIRLTGHIAAAVGDAANDRHAALRAPPGDEIRAARAAWAAAQLAIGKEHAQLCSLLRDICRHPDCRTPIDVSRLTPKALAIAQDIYDARTFDRLPLLADALEDAGCTDADILGHCRGGGEHVRGCWVVDLLLGKQ